MNSTALLSADHRRGVVTLSDGARASSRGVEAPRPHEQPSLWRRISRLPAQTLLLVLRAYQSFLSPVLPIVTLGGCACRFTPSCSHYAVEAVRTHGAARGAWLALRRLLKCTPLHPGGFDPVPAPRERPVCRASSPFLPPTSLRNG